ncbi:MAG: hypothetical protein ACD_52C00236G0001 [uncultured bacterium]|nr:MAG: hypothetical protein ACD_52C00236G0001 [uncultured bacterium]
MKQSNPLKNTLSFFSEVKSEVAKVTWPSKNEVTKLTMIVVTVSLLVGIYLGGLDFLFTKLLELVVYNN